MVAILFGGPSLEGIDLSGKKLVLLPPACQGDLLRYVKELKPNAVGLLDCELPYRDIPTWHKEIIYTLNLGIPVAGAAAVGAHRAAELASFGMEGVGSIYQRIASGELERDDEVIGDWEKTESGIKKLSLPLVVMRDAIFAAEKEGVISKDTVKVLTETAQGLFWRIRTWDSLFNKAFSQGLDEERLAPFRSWLPKAQDTVRKDASALIKRLEELEKEKTVKPGGGLRDSERSSLFKSMNTRDRSVSSSSGQIRQWCMADMATFAHPDAEEINRSGLNRKLVLLLGTLWKIEPKEGFLKLEKKRLFKKLGLETDEDLESWLNENDMDMKDFERITREEAIVHHLHRWLMQGRIHEKNTGIFLDEMKLLGRYPDWKKKADRRESLLRENRDIYREEAEKVSQMSFLQSLREHLMAKKLPWNGSLVEIIPETGMEASDLKYEMIASRVERVSLKRILGGSGDKGSLKKDGK